jgi:hypothetical protein
MEGRRAGPSESSWDDERLPDSTKYPRVGASIAISSKHSALKVGCGTLGGYVLIDGKVMGLTNHHVAFGESRLEAFPTADEASTGVSYSFLQPAEVDLEARINYLEDRRQILIDDQKTMEDTSLQAAKISTIAIELEKLRLLTPETSVLGKVWRSSGLRARDGAKNRRFRLHWALIELENPGRFTEQEKFVNEVWINCFVTQ